MAVTFRHDDIVNYFSLVDNGGSAPALLSPVERIHVRATKVDSNGRAVVSLACGQRNNLDVYLGVLLQENVGGDSESIACLQCYGDRFTPGSSSEESDLAYPEATGASLVDGHTDWITQSEQEDPRDDHVRVVAGSCLNCSGALSGRA